MENISVAGEFGRKPALSFDGTPSDELVVEVLHAGDGQIVEAGRPAEFFSSPRTERARDFLSKVLSH